MRIGAHAAEAAALRDAEDAASEAAHVAKRRARLHEEHPRTAATTERIALAADEARDARERQALRAHIADHNNGIDTSDSSEDSDEVSPSWLDQKKAEKNENDALKRAARHRHTRCINCTALLADRDALNCKACIDGDTCAKCNAPTGLRCGKGHLVTFHGCGQLNGCCREAFHMRADQDEHDFKGLPAEHTTGYPAMKGQVNNPGRCHFCKKQRTARCRHGHVCFANNCECVPEDDDMDEGKVGALGINETDLHTATNIYTPVEIFPLLT